MARKESSTERIALSLSRKYPLLLALQVDPKELVRFVLTKRSAFESVQRRKIGDDARDYANTAHFLKPLSEKTLAEVERLTQSELRQRLKHKKYPFARLNKKTRETLRHLPKSWVLGAAQWELDARKLS